MSRKLVNVGLAVAVVCTSVVGPAHAVLRANAWSVAPVRAFQYSCVSFTFGEGKIINNCPGSGWTAIVEIPLLYDSLGSKAVSFTMAAPVTGGRNGPVCSTLFANESVFIKSPGASLTKVNTYQTVTTAPISVSGDGEFWLDCLLIQGTAMTTVAYNE
jgi:hypothetical protein